METLTSFGPDIWISDGTPVTVAGFHYPTRMAVIRLADGGLFIWSPINLTPQLKSAVDALGTVRHIVAPNHLHHLFIKAWIDTYPGARSYAAPRLQRKRKDLIFDAILSNDAPLAWEGDIAQVVVAGNLLTTEIVFFHRASATVLFTDLLQQIPADALQGWRATVARLDLMTGPEPAVPRKFRLAFHDRKAARRAVRQILEWPAKQVLMAHGTPVTKKGQDFIASAFDWLLG